MHLAVRLLQFLFIQNRPPASPAPLEILTFLEESRPDALQALPYSEFFILFPSRKLEAGL